jgi:hypothetical protein
MLHGEGRVEDNILDLDIPSGKLVYFLVLFEEDAVSVSEIKNTPEGGQLGICFNLLDDQSRNGDWCKCIVLLSFLS